MLSATERRQLAAARQEGESPLDHSRRRLSLRMQRRAEMQQAVRRNKAAPIPGYKPQWQPEPAEHRQNSQPLPPEAVPHRAIADKQPSPGRGHVPQPTHASARSPTDRLPMRLDGRPDRLTEELLAPKRRTSLLVEASELKHRQQLGQEQTRQGRGSAGSSPGAGSGSGSGAPSPGIRTRHLDLGARDSEHVERLASARPGWRGQDRAKGSELGTEGEAGEA